MPLLRNPEPPRLPDPENEYNPRFMGALLQTLRLYFNQLSAITSGITTVRGGTFIDVPTGVFRANTQALPANTPGAVTFTATSHQNGVRLTAPDTMVVEQSGLYEMLLQVSLQNTGLLSTVNFWLRRNGVDILDSRVELEQTLGTGLHSYVLTGALLRDDTVQLLWNTSDANTQLQDRAAAGPFPAQPAITARLRLISATTVVDP